jgi:Ca2+-binding EF-hand superfamily protein
MRDVTLVAQYAQKAPNDKTDFALADLNNDGVIDSTDVEILINIVTGKTQAGTATPTPVPAAATQTVVKGDINGDGKVDREDVLLAVKMATGLLKPSDKELKAGDMDGDGKITVKDATLIQEKVGYKLGDVNGDGKIDGEDVKLALLFATGKAQPSEQQLRAADVNNDGKITLSDVMAIQKMAIAALPSVTQAVAEQIKTSTAPSPQPTSATKLTAQQKTVKAVQKGLTNAGSNIFSILLLSFLISIAVSGIWWALSKK